MSHTRILHVVLLHLSLLSFAQKQANIWYFGNCAGLNFNGGAPMAITGPICHAGAEGTSVLSDSAGNILLCSDGMTIWNRLGQVMQNGTGLLGHYSSTQSSMIVPDPSAPDRYIYVFTVSSGMVSPGSINDGLRYSKVDMCLDQGNGGVIPTEKNIKLVDSVSEKLAACRHANGVDYWIVTHKFYSDKFVALKLTAAGITQTVVSAEGSYHGGSLSQTMGQLKFSHNRNRVAIGAANGGNILDLADFSSSTGVISNAVALQKPNFNNAGVYGIEFSPDNSKLYCQGATSSGTLNNLLWQYDLAAGGGNINSVNASMIILETVGGLAPKGLQLGPDNKIYRPNINPNNWLSVIANPNAAGTSCGYVAQAISLGSNTGAYTPPSFILDFDYSNTLLPAASASIAGVSATMVCRGNQVSLTSLGPGNHTWSTGQTGTLVVVTPTITTTYGVSNSACGSAAVTVSVQPCVSADEQSRTMRPEVFPNPVSGAVYLKGNAGCAYVVTDPFGRIAREGSIGEGPTMVDLSDLAQGLYFVKFASEGHEYTIRLLCK
jgi:hypothetical protein